MIDGSAPHDDRRSANESFSADDIVLPFCLSFMNLDVVMFAKMLIDRLSRTSFHDLGGIYYL
jgi:hypothetical protein